MPNESTTLNNDHEPKRPVKLILLFSFFIFIGFIPWERWLSIEIRAEILQWVTSDTIGLVGVGGLICAVLLHIMNNYERFSGLAMLLLPVTLFPLGIIILLSFILPSFEWRDEYVYRNGKEYLILQNKEGFVTSSLPGPRRIILTSSASGAIRIIQERRDLNTNDDNFEGNQVVYNGKTWSK